jgi:hypothetical protein
MKRVEILRDSRKLKEANEASLHAIYINKDTPGNTERTKTSKTGGTRREKQT